MLIPRMHCYLIGIPLGLLRVPLDEEPLPTPTSDSKGEVDQPDLDLDLDSWRTTIYLAFHFADTQILYFF